MKTYSLESIYLLFLFMLSFYKGIFLDGNNIYNIIFLGYLIFLVIKILKEKWKVKELLGIGLIGVILGINYIYSKDLSLLASFILLIGTKNIPLEKIFRVILISKVMGYTLVILFVSLKIIPNSIIYFERNGEILYRYSWGFGHPNPFHAFFCLIVLLIIFEFYKQFNFVWATVILSLNYIIYSYSYSRTSALLVIISVVLVLSVKKWGYIKLILLKSTKYSYAFFFLLSIILSQFLYGTNIYYFLDKMLTGRLHYAHILFNSSLTLFGKSFDSFYLGEYGGVLIHDNSYTSRWSLYGIIINILLIVIYFFTAKQLSKQKNYKGLILCFVSALLFFSEDYIGQVFTNLTLFVSAKFLFGELNEEIGEYDGKN